MFVFERFSDSFLWCFRKGTFFFKLKMKVTLFCLLLAVVASQTAVVNGPSSRTNFQAGYIQPGDRLLNRSYLQRYAISNAIQYQDFTYRGNATTRISLVTATEVGATQYGAAWILSGGVGWNYVTLRVQSARGWGYYYMIEVWGR